MFWLIAWLVAGFLVQTLFSQKIGTVILFLAFFLFVYWSIEELIETSEIDKKCRSINKRFSLIEKRLGLLDETDEKDLIAKPVAYKIQLGLLPHWEKILEKLAEQNEQKPDDFIKEIVNDKELGIETGEGLYWKDFWFNIYQDEYSGMRQVWSHHHKAMADSWLIQGHLFEPWPIISLSTPKKYTYNYVSQLFTLTPWRACFERFYSENDVIKGRTVNPNTGTPYNDVFKDGKIAEIPYFEITKLLLELGKILTPHDYAIKQFPKELKQKLEENNVKYDNESYSFSFNNLNTNNGDSDKSGLDRWNNTQWFKDRGVELYQDTVESHAFHTPYYSVSISLEIFESTNLPYH